MKNWIELSGDMSWDDYGATWARKAPDGSWYVLKFENMLNAIGEREFASSGMQKYECQVKRVDLRELPEKELASALKCCGYDLVDGHVETDHDGETVCCHSDKCNKELVLLDCCISYGLGAPLGEEWGNRAVNVRASARRLAESLMKDASALDERLDKPVNALGSTAREYGLGDIDSAMMRGDSKEHQLMRKLHGIPEEHRVQFGALHENGELTNVRSIRQSDMLKCPHAIMVQEHYRDDGSCKCDDAEHRAMMIKDWEYSEQDFAGIALRK